MTVKTYNVLFLCTHNSARSILAEGLMNSVGRGMFKAYSAGSHPSGSVHPQALKTLERLRVPIGDYRSKDWSEFAQPNAPVMDFVFTVCDKAAGEQCPVWPGQPMTAHWGVPDPAAAPGDAEALDKAFWEAATILKRRIDLMLALPVASLDRLTLQQQVRDIGTR